MELSADNQSETHCALCGEIDRQELIHSEMIRPALIKLIKNDFPNFSSNGRLCHSCLNRYRAEYVEDVLQRERGELSQIEQEVVSSLAEQETVSQDLNASFQDTLTVGEKIADNIAQFGGSWSFLTFFGIAILLWIVINGFALDTFDPYPFILLNLLLSCLAALQAPIIMMSQNRQEAKDRLRSEHDYRINLKAELEIRHLHLKLDQLLSHQWNRLLEVQKMQMEILSELTK